MKVELTEQEIEMCITGLSWAVNEGKANEEDTDRLIFKLTEIITNKHTVKT